MMRKLFLLSGLLLLLAGIAYGDDAKQRRAQDRERLFEISKEVGYKTFFERYPYLVNDPKFRKYKDDKPDKFCRAFLNDLREKKDIEFADPIVETDDYNDPKLQSYLGKCPKLELNKMETFEARWVKGKSDEEIEKMKGSGWIYYANLDFKLYQVDFDNNPKNGEEYLFYADGWYDPVTKTEHSANYTVVDFNKCKRLGDQGVSGSITYPTRHPTKNFNGILRYKGRYYIYDVMFSPKDFGLDLYKWDEKIKGHTIGVCTFDGQIKQQTQGGAN